MNTIEDIFSEYAERITDSAKEQKSTFIQYCKGISSLIPDSFYVLDIVQKQFIQARQSFSVRPFRERGDGIRI